MDSTKIRICSGCGEEFENLETQLDGKDYCSSDCFIEYNNPYLNCGDIVPVGEGVHYKNEGSNLCWKCACCTDSAPNKPAETTKQVKISLYEKNRRAVYATGNKWAIENFNATH